MTPNPVFLKQPPKFWAYARSISQSVGYTARGEGQVRVPSIEEMAGALKTLGLDSSLLTARQDRATPIGEALQAYFEYRARTLNTFVEPRLMT